MITIVDYGVGNINAFLNVYKRLNIEAKTVQTAADLQAATKIVLPGVGHFDHTMQRLDESGMRQTLDELALGRGVPVLGVCVGMQMLGRSSDEGTRPGLGWIDGTVRRFASWQPAAALPLPHMGWNDVRSVSTTRLFSELENEARFYFLHSFYFECASQSNSIAVATYGGDFSCAVNRDNIYGVQFHPEKSHQFGMRLLKNFAEL